MRPGVLPTLHIAGEHQGKNVKQNLFESEARAFSPAQCRVNDKICYLFSILEVIGKLSEVLLEQSREVISPINRGSHILCSLTILLFCVFCFVF